MKHFYGFSLVNSLGSLLAGSLICSVLTNTITLQSSAKQCFYLLLQQRNHKRTIRLFMAGSFNFPISFRLGSLAGPITCQLSRSPHSGGFRIGKSRKHTRITGLHKTFIQTIKSRGLTVLIVFLLITILPVKTVVTSKCVH